MTDRLAERYLARLNIEAPTTFDLATLSAILEAHLRAIPFENVSSFTGTPVDLTPEVCFAKLLEQGRGGYCMEHAALSNAALKALGFKCEPFFARVLFGPEGDRPSPQTHCGAVVHIDDETYIFDPGFGRFAPSIPVRTTNHPSGKVQEGKYMTYRMRTATDAAPDAGASRVAEDVEQILEAKLGDDWIALYGITRRPVVVEDIIPLNWYISTYPKSIFFRAYMAATWDGDKRVTAFNGHFKKSDGANVIEEADVASEEDCRRWLVEEMGLHLDGSQVKRFWEKIQAVNAAAAN